jgi:hypothetical protein
MPLVLVVAHRKVQIVDAITVIHLTICNNNGNNTLSMRKYSSRLTRLKLNKVTLRIMQYFLLVD